MAVKRIGVFLFCLISLALFSCSEEIKDKNSIHGMERESTDPVLSVLDPIVTQTPSTAGVDTLNDSVLADVKVSGDVLSTPENKSGFSKLKNR